MTERPDPGTAGPRTDGPDVAAPVGATPRQVALAWLLQRSPTMLLIPGTSSVAHLRENLASVDVVLPPAAVATLDGIAGS